MACHFELVEEMARIEEKYVEQKMGMWTATHLLHSVESVANHQQTEGESEASR